MVTMSIELIKANDCICKTRLHNTTKNSLTTDKKGIELISKEDCSTVKNSCVRARKRTQREIGHSRRHEKRI